MAVTTIIKGKQSDPILVREQLEALQTCRAAWGDAAFMMYFVWILTKEPDPVTNSRYVPFALNEIQMRLNDELTLYNLLLKARQMGGTTFMMIKRLLLPAVTTQGFRGLFVSQKQAYANQHFFILDRARRTFGMVKPGGGSEVNKLAESLNRHLLKRRLANRRELLFENLDSSVFVDTAENDEAGQGFTSNGFVGSEFSRWPKNPAETLANIRGSLAPRATVDLECTANGAQGPFYELVNLALEGEGIYKLNFFEWWHTHEYRLDLTPTQSKELKADLADIDSKMEIEKETKQRAEIESWKRDEYLIRSDAHLQLQQVAWRRSQLSADAKRFRENYPEDPRSCFLTEGNSFFDNEVIARRKLELKNFRPYKIGRNKEAILFWKPRPNVRYLIGSDVSEGMSANESGTDLDYSCAHVIEQDSGEQVAHYRARVRPDQLAADLAYLGRMYNNAVIAVERNSYGTATLLFLEREENYPNIYMHPHLEEITGTVGGKMGFPTDKSTRPIALSYVQRWVEENPNMVWSEEFCSECLSFIRTPAGRPQAAAGAHDDSVAAAWVAHGARAFLNGFWVPIRARNAQGDED
jgi:hypothetical protein